MYVKALTYLPENLAPYESKHKNEPIDQQMHKFTSLLILQPKV